MSSCWTKAIHCCCQLTGAQATALESLTPLIGTCFPLMKRCPVGESSLVAMILDVYIEFASKRSSKSD